MIGLCNYEGSLRSFFRTVSLQSSGEVRECREDSSKLEPCKQMLEMHNDGLKLMSFLVASELSGS